jgi:quercetin dioxygenase-like cupin family protein
MMPVRHVSEIEGYQAPDASQRVIQFLVDPETTPLREMKMGITTISPGKATHVAVHAREEIYLVLQGSGWVLLGGSRSELRPGSVVAIASDAPHQIGATSTELVYAWISSSPPATVSERRSWRKVSTPAGPFAE